MSTTQATFFSITFFWNINKSHPLRRTDEGTVRDVRAGSGTVSTAKIAPKAGGRKRVPCTGEKELRSEARNRFRRDGQIICLPQKKRTIVRAPTSDAGYRLGSGIEDDDLRNPCVFFDPKASFRHDECRLQRRMRPLNLEGRMTATRGEQTFVR